MSSKQDVIGLSKWELDTPCLLLDRKLLQHNLLTMQAAANSANKYLRPHSKTHKCSKLAKLQIETGSFGICVTKISEAEVLVNKGVKNILITSPVTVPKKIDNLIACVALDPEITVVVDNMENARQLNSASRNIDHELNVLVDVDPNVGRTGVSFDDALQFAKFIQTLPFLNLRGIQCYAGNLQHIKSFSEREKASQYNWQRAVQLLQEFAEAGLTVDIVTGSGTGTYMIDAQIPEITELQPGSYVVMDAEYFGIADKQNEPFKTFKPAMTLLATVISNNHQQHVTIDAGIKALYYSESLPLVLSPEHDMKLHYQWGYGDEHGKILKPENFELSLNSVVELIVPHCDPTINMFDQYYITSDDIVIDVWPIDMRGKSQ